MKDIPDYRFIYDLLQKSQYGIRFYDEGLFETMLELMQVFDSSGLYLTPYMLVPYARKTA